MRNFINKKAKNVKSDRTHRTTVIIDNKVKVEEVKPVVINAELIPIYEEIVEKLMEVSMETTPIEPTDTIIDIIEEQPKPKKKKNNKKENKETKIED